MGEIAINPIHNVHKKYRTMNFVNPYIFAPPVDLSTNTEIGGVAATINTPALLATKLGISVGAISNFTVVGSDIKCKITGSYAMPLNCWDGNINITHFIDEDGLVSSLGSSSFYGATNIKTIDFNGVTSVGTNVIFNSGIEKIFLRNCPSILANSFQYGVALSVAYIPECSNLGGTPGNNGVFAGISQTILIYSNPSLSTNNSGLPDGDLTGQNVRYVSNYTSPNPIVNLSAGTIYNTAIQLNFTPPSSTNAIDYYECYANGVFKNNISASGGYVTGLSAGTSYNITLKVVDVLLNKSLVSNIVTQSTDNYSYMDTDANTSISAKSLTGSEQESEYLLITGLKSNNLYAKCQAIYTFKGAAAAQQKFNSKNPIDTDGAFRLTFSGTASFSNLGYQLNGSSYANTHFVPSVQQTLNSNGMTVVCGTNNPAFSSNVVETGAYNGAAQASYLMVKNNNTNYKRRTTLNSETVECSQSGINESRGIFTGTKQSSTVTDLFVNGSQVATSNQSSGVLPTLNIYIGALNFSNSAVTNSNQRIQMVIFHEGLSDAEVTTLHAIIDLSEAIAGRKTW